MLFMNVAICILLSMVVLATVALLGSDAPLALKCFGGAMGVMFGCLIVGGTWASDW